MDVAQSGQYWLTRFWLQRTIGFTYFIGFLIVVNQWRGLVGEKGLLPVPLFLKRIDFWDSPSLFFLHYSDIFALVIAVLGLFLSVLALSGIADAYGTLVSVTVWTLLWMIYLSFVNVGQTFYGFGWETLLLEAGFLTIFLGPSQSEPSQLMIWLFRWLAFRVMFGAGMIKIRGDECWRDLTCMNYHYETQPLPNPLSRLFHQTPSWFHKVEVLFTHFVEVVVPFFFFFPSPLRTLAGIITILFQGTLILSGNLSWLNYITAFITLSCFDDAFFARFSTLGMSGNATLGGISQPILWVLGLVIGGLSIRPAINLVSSEQKMNASFEPLHIVNTYGAFGSITRTRYEVILEGTNDSFPNANTQWIEYEFKGKPGSPARNPPVVSPYHWKLDWQMWFAAMSPYHHHPWILNLVSKLLQNDKSILNLMSRNPFPNKPPEFIRAELYEYHFADKSDPSGHWWKRKWVGEYLPPLNLHQESFQRVLKAQGWLQ